MKTTLNRCAGGLGLVAAQWARVSLLAGVVVLGACAAPPRPAAPPPSPAATGATAGTTLTGPPQSKASTVDGYKREVALHIYRSNPAAQFDGAPPPLLRSVVVLTIRIDSVGNPVHVAVVRSNGYRELEDAAIGSVRAAAPLPMPTRAVARNGSAEFYETWLFRDDGLYQIRSLAEPQALVEN